MYCNTVVQQDAVMIDPGFGNYFRILLCMWPILWGRYASQHPKGVSVCSGLNCTTKTHRLNEATEGCTVFDAAPPRRPRWEKKNVDLFCAKVTGRAVVSPLCVA